MTFVDDSFDEETNHYAPAHNVHYRWFKNCEGWCKAEVRVYATGEPQQDYIEWGLSDKEYFLRKLTDDT